MKCSQSHNCLQQMSILRRDLQECFVSKLMLNDSNIYTLAGVPNFADVGCSSPTSFKRQSLISSKKTNLVFPVT